MTLWQAAVRRLAALTLALSLVLGLAACDESLELYLTLPQSAAPAVSTDVLTDTLEVHFLDVGQALSVLVRCGDGTMLYDGGNAADGSYLVSYLYDAGVKSIDYVFCSHAHEDHVGGLAAALAAFPAAHAYSPVASSSNTYFQDYVKYASQQNLDIEVPTPGTSWPLGGATVTMLGPLRTYEDNVNNSSIVLRIDYGTTSFLLTGDMEMEAERDLVDSGANLKADVLQVGHHGSSTSSSYVFMKAVLPEMAVISCGVNNDYGHPHRETLSILRDAGVDVYRTDLQGAIVITSDGANYTVRSEKQADDTTLNPTVSSSAASQQAYIGNLNSKKFHLPTCNSLPAEHNQILFSSYDEAIAAGYSPCQSCIH